MSVCLLILFYIIVNSDLNKTKFLEVDKNKVSNMNS